MITKNQKLLTLFAALLCITTAWAEDYRVSSDSELRAAIQNNNANITVTADIDLSNSTLSIEGGKTITIDLGGHTLDRKLKWRGEGGGQVITVRNGATLNLTGGTLKGGWGGNAGGLSNESGTANLTNVNITGCTGDDSVGDFRRIRPDTPQAWWGAFRSMYCPDELPATNRLTITLSGQRLSKSSQKGLYINNGNKIIIE